MNVLKKAADNTNLNSFANTLRRKRFEKFAGLLATVPRPLRMLDVGGTEAYWAAMGFGAESGVEIVLLNLSATSVTLPNCKSVAGDARDLRQFRDKEFDVVFSNSVIEHVGEFADQKRMADEVSRVGKRYFVQTPNYYFPVEPHFLVPLFQFMPRALQLALVSKFDLGWSKKAATKVEAERLVDSVRLLTRGELQRLFPDGQLLEEKFLGLSKSYTAIGGW